MSKLAISTLPFAFAMAIASTPSTAANGGFQTGNELYAKCNANEREPTYYQEMAYCSAYIIGVFDNMQNSRHLASLADCSPDSVTAGQVRDVVLAHLRNNPSSRHLSAAFLTRIALAKAWEQCKLIP